MYCPLIDSLRRLNPNPPRKLQISSALRRRMPGRLARGAMNKCIPGRGDRKERAVFTVIQSAYTSANVLGKGSVDEIPRDAIGFGGQSQAEEHPAAAAVVLEVEAGVDEAL